MFFRELYYETKYFFEELILLFKHPTRERTYNDLQYHFSKILNILFGHPWYCLKRGIRNLYIWFPIIWKNDSWDHFFILDMMDKQFKEMEDFFGSDKPITAKAKQVHKRLKWIRILQDKWREEYYTMLEYEKHKAKFPNEPSFFEHDEEDITRDEYGIPILYRCKPQSIECTNDYRIHSDIGRIKDEKCFRLWIKNLSRIREFWD